MGAADRGHRFIHPTHQGPPSLQAAHMQTCLMSIAGFGHCAILMSIRVVLGLKTPRGLWVSKSMCVLLPCFFYLCVHASLCEDTTFV